MSSTPPPAQPPGQPSEQPFGPPSDQHWGTPTTTPSGAPGGYPPSTGAQPPGYRAYDGADLGAPTSPYAHPGPAGPSATTPSATTPPSSNARTLGWVGVGLLYVLALWQLVLPTVRTFAQSTSAGNPFMGEPGESVGLQNWFDVLPQVAPTLGFVLLAVVPVTIVAAALGAAVATAMTPASGTATATRALVGALTVLFVPIGVALGLRGTDGTGLPLGTAGEAAVSIAVLVTLSLLPILVAAFATAFGAASAARGGRGAGVVVGVAGLAAVAGALQVVAMPQVLTGGGPGDATQTPQLLSYRLSFTMFEFGRGTAVDSLVLLVLGLLGLLATALVVGTRSRLVVIGPDGGAPGRSGLLGVIVAGLVLVAGVLTMLPVLGAPSTDELDGLRVVGTTWSAAAVGAGLQLLVALLGAVAIGWCRPLGDRSLWLLLPLAPWVFVGQGPLAAARFIGAQDSGALNTWAAAVPPVVLVAPVLVLALLMSGLREHPSSGGRTALVGASLLTFAVLTVTQAQALLPSYITVSDPELWTAPLALLQVAARWGPVEGVPGLGLLYPVPLLLVMVALGVVAQLALRRVALVRS